MVVFLQSALIISYADKNSEPIIKILKALSFKKIALVNTCGEARRKTMQQSFDLFIINSPVHNESGEDLAVELVKNDISQVVFFVKSELYDYTSEKLEQHGIITVAKPINKNMLYSSLKLSKAVYYRMKTLNQKATKLTKKLEDVRIVSRAKLVLIKHLNMSEEQAHKHIEKKAMDTRESRREVAENILKLYEN